MSMYSKKKYKITIREVKTDTRPGRDFSHLQLRKAGGLILIIIFYSCIMNCFWLNFNLPVKIYIGTNI